MIRAAALVLLLVSPAWAIKSTSLVELVNNVLRDPADICAAANMNCDGVTSDSTALALAAALRAGAEIIIPAKKTLVIDATFTIPDGTTVRCGEGGTIRARGKVCTGGHYPGSFCGVDADCLGGGTCDTTAAFAPTGGTTYTMVQAAASAARVAIIGCTLDANQYDPNGAYICTGGTNNGRACRHMCSNLSGFGCDADADCSPGTCSFLTDCETATSPGDCNGESAAPSGPGTINPLDLSAATVGIADGTIVKNHRRGTSVTLGGGRAYGLDNTGYLSAVFPLAVFGPAGTNTVALAAGLRVLGTAKVEDVTLRGTTYGVELGTAASGAKLDSGTITTTQTDGIGVWSRGSKQRILNLDVTAEKECVRLDGPSAAVYSRVAGLFCQGTDYHDSTGVNVEGGGQYNVEADFSGVFNPIYIGPKGGNVNLSGQSRYAFGCGPKIALQSFGGRVNGPYEAWESGGCGYCPSVSPVTICDLVDYCPGGLCTGGGGTTCVGGVKNGAACRDGCASGSCVPFPDILLGTWKPKMVALAHVEVRGGLLHTSVAGTPLVAASPPTKRCTGGFKAWEPCTTSNTTDCPHMCGGTALNAGTQCSASTTCTCDSNDDCPGSTCSSVPGPGTCVAGTACGGGGNVASIPPGGGTCSVVTNTDVVLSDVKLLSASSSVIGIDLSNFGANSPCTNCTVNGAEVDLTGATTVGIKFPTDTAGLTNIRVHGVHFGASVVDKLLNWSWAMGSITGSGPLDPDDDQGFAPLVLNNSSGGTINANELVELNTSTANSVVKTTSGSKLPLGVMLDGPANGANGQVATTGVVTVRTTDTTIIQGARLRASSTAGYAEAASSSDFSFGRAAGASVDQGSYQTVRVTLTPSAGTSLGAAPIVNTTTASPGTAFGGTATAYTVYNYAAPGLTGSKTATVRFNIVDTDTGNGVEQMTWTAYRATTSCPTVGSTTVPTGTQLSGTYVTEAQSSAAGVNITSTLEFTDSATASGTNNYCLVASRSGGTQGHTFDNVTVVVVEYQ